MVRIFNILLSLDLLGDTPPSHFSEKEERETSGQCCCRKLLAILYFIAEYTNYPCSMGFTNLNSLLIWENVIFF